MAKKQQQGRTRGSIKPGRRVGTYTVRVYVGTDASGKRQYASKLVAGTISQAKLALTQMLAEIDTGDYVAPSNQTVKQYVDGWITGTAAARVSPRTLVMYQYLMEHYAYPAIGHKALDQLLPQHVQKMVSDMAVERGLGYRTIQYTATVLKAALGQAVKWRQLKWNPADDITLPSAAGKKPKRILTAEQVRIVLTGTVDRPYHAFWSILLHAGLRPQEAAALTWSDIKGNVLRVNKAMVEVKPGHYEIGPCKTRKSVRIVPVSGECAAAIARHRSAQIERIMRAGEQYDRSADLVFSTRDGKPLCLHNLYRAFQADLKAVGLAKAITMYQCRHTHLSLLLSNGAPVKDVSDRAGHASAKMTLDEYAQVLPGHGERLAESFGRILAVG